MNARVAGINTYSYIWSHPIRECLAGLAALGYRQFEGVINPPHLDLDTSPQARREIVALMRGEGLSFTSLNLPSLDTNLASPFADTRAYSVGMFKKAIVLAAELHASCLVTVPGRLSPLLAPARALSRAWVQDTVQTLVPYAREHGVKLAIENVPFAALPTARDIGDFLDEMGNGDVLCACYDAANAHFIGEALHDGVRSLAGRIALLHCSDTTRTAWRHDPIGKGDVPFGQLAAALGAQAYAGPILLEIIDQDAQASIVQSHDALAGAGVVAPREG
ncbi:sugar phosphate isomerase/epimerase [Bordetella sp. BOR01]|uniref:sugar phosphate isomerase/epimerase family protein n=1 Tax=Bordetella sp. BOR01 TaxID=2854779 RepID=UPI001C47F683|nr:sugar phosphate isomerase/epimerase family protein [Bordetella sp. BOR01]MBV7484770.1 sugar phosphate isomerase/epimerase [Bordetella sp. BOR01]